MFAPVLVPLDRSLGVSAHVDFALRLSCPGFRLSLPRLPPWASRPPHSALRVVSFVVSRLSCLSRRLARVAFVAPLGSLWSHSPESEDLSQPRRLSPRTTLNALVRTRGTCSTSPRGPGGHIVLAPGPLCILIRSGPSRPIVRCSPRGMKMSFMAHGGTTAAATKSDTPKQKRFIGTSFFPEIKSNSEAPPLISTS